jgi:hypothetical protein
LTAEWILELGEEPEVKKARHGHTFGNLTLTAYNSELGNIPFAAKKLKLQTTHIELNRWVLVQEKWGESEIMERSEILYKMAEAVWVGPA